MTDRVSVRGDKIIVSLVTGCDGIAAALVMNHEQCFAHIKELINAAAKARENAKRAGVPAGFTHGDTGPWPAKTGAKEG